MSFPMNLAGSKFRPIPRTRLMPRKSPTRAEAFPAANRRNARKCAGRRTPEGKAGTSQGKGRSSLNGLKHCHCGRSLPEKPEAAGYRLAAAPAVPYGKIRSEVVATSKVEHPEGVKRAERVGALVSIMGWKSGFSALNRNLLYFLMIASIRRSPTRKSILGWPTKGGGFSLAGIDAQTRTLGNHALTGLTGAACSKPHRELSKLRRSDARRG